MWFDMFLELIYDGKKKKGVLIHGNIFIKRDVYVMKLYQIIYPKHNLMRKPKY